jgi:predicted component of type VI protein secretion system
MNRTEYKAARTLIRANGPHALRWIDTTHASIMRDIITIQCRVNLLAWRSCWTRNDSAKVRLLLTTPFQSVLSRFA